jgi:hypothetical protein
MLKGLISMNNEETEFYNPISIWALALVLVVPMSLMAWIIFVVGSVTDGTFTYSHDDAYIHLGAAKNLLDNGCLGINSKYYIALISSPLFTILLAGLMWIFGREPSIILYSLLIFYSGFVYVVWLRFSTYKITTNLFIFWGLLTALAVPIVYALQTGMEHIIHLCISVILFLEWQMEKETSKNNHVILLSLLVAVSTLFRFDTMFLVGPLAAVDLAKGRYKRALSMTVACALPMLAYFAIGALSGSSFMPNSLRVKSSPSGKDLFATIEFYVWRLIVNIRTPERAWFYVVAFAATFYGVWGVFIAKRKLAEGWLVYGLTFLAASTSYFLIGPVTRYELWIVGILVLLVTLEFSEWFSLKATVFATGMSFMFLILLNKYYAYLFYTYLATNLEHSNFSFYASILVSLLGLCFLAFLVYKFMGKSALQLVPISASLCFLLVGVQKRLLSRLNDYPLYSKDIYDQQIQMARFIKTYYNGQHILMNDIGTTSFFTSCTILDRTGLGTDALTKINAKNFVRMNPAAIMPTLDSLRKVEKVKIAVVYELWLAKIPSTWLKVGYMESHNTFLLGDKRVTFFAYTPADARLMAKNLHSFAPKLPETNTLTFMPGY